MQAETSQRPFGMRDKIGYLFGDFGNDFTFIFASSFLMVFYTKVLGIDPAAVGVLFVIARCIDAFTDVTMGRLVDTFQGTKQGRFRPWILWISGPVALMSFLMYQSALASAPMIWKLVYMYVTYILWGSVFYTMINIPYGSMASVISSNPEHRASLSTYRSVGAGLAALLIGVGAPLLIYTTDASGNQVVSGGRFTLIAGVFSVLAVICYLLCYALTTERVNFVPGKTQKKVSLGETFSALLHNRALVAIIGAAIFLLLSQLITQNLNNYLFADYFKDTRALSLINILSTVPMLLIAPFVIRIIQRYGKKESGMAATFAAGLAYLALFFLKIKNPYVYCAVAAIASLGQGYFNLIIWAYITDVIDYQEVRHHTRDDGTIYAVYSFARKIGQALAGGLGGFALSLIGYDSLATVQADSVLQGIYNTTTLVPAVSFLIVAAILAFGYPLNKKLVEQNHQELLRRHKA